MIRIEHIAVWTSDVERLTAFYATYFDATAGERYENPRWGFASRFLSFPDGPRFEIMSSTVIPTVPFEPGAQRMGLTHVALSVGSEQAVNAITERLRTDGYRVVDEARWTGDGYYESVILDPDGTRTEITI
ncbi:MAG: VOC family protein [Gemmatimonadaceae bacterium]|jgi:lactoylglutathione lyase|nr:VOC family protein [Gemmatimonadaceae bacterium]